MRELLSRRFKHMNRLYHFTNYEAACSIIRSKQLRFGKRSNMNDLIESRKITTRRVFFADIGDDMSKEYFPEKEMMRYQQISFAQDRNVEDTLLEGFNLHSMWGLYAERGYGVCLVFDKDKLKLGKTDYARDVVYKDWIMPDYDFKSSRKSEIRAEIWKRRDDFFFLKRKEWEREQEYRIIRRAKNETDDEYLDVSESLAFAIISREESLRYDEPIWSGKYYRHIKYISNRKLPVLWYTPSMDGYCLYHDWMEPVWTEEGGFESWD